MAVDKLSSKSINKLLFKIALLVSNSFSCGPVFLNKAISLIISAKIVSNLSKFKAA
jgi:hypothetical protein